MRYFVLALDYDGTIAHHGKVTPETVTALQKLLDTGRRLVMVTGRELDELLAIFPEIDLFEWVVAENGALLYRPSNREEKALAEPPPLEFIHALRQRGVAPISVGRVIVATWEPHQHVVLETIREFGLELQVIFNKGAVMVLPAGVNKAFGLKAALKQMNLSQHEAVGAGDAENDHAFLDLCECSAAVSNALPALKERVSILLKGDHGVGIAELIDEIVASDLAARAETLTKLDPVIGVDELQRPMTIPAYGPGILIAGPSGSGKSTTTTSLVEQLAENKYQFCIIDPEGDYESLPFSATIGTGDRGPSVQEVQEMLSPPGHNVVVNLIGFKLSERPEFFSRLLPPLLHQREQNGRPHWLIIDEAHHLLPPSWEMGTATASKLNRAVFITVHPEQVHPEVLTSIGTVIAVGNLPGETFRKFCEAIQIQPPACEVNEQESGWVTIWDRHSTQPPKRVQIAAPKVERQRHIRKYAEGELPPERSFYFRGAESKLNLRAQNLMLFLQMAEGIDEETWLHHLRAGDYSNWFRVSIKDDVLAQEAAEVEQDGNASAAESRERIRAAVERRYTLPITVPRLSNDEDVTALPKTATPS